jgi:hypothetical protein
VPLFDPLLSKEYYSCLLFVDLVQVTGDNLEEAIVKVAEGNILDQI